MSHEILSQLSLVLAIALAISLLVRLLRQPLIVGYILTGLVVGPSMLGIVTLTNEFQALADFGVTVLLFVAGLGMSLKIPREIRRLALFTTFIQFGIIALTGGVVSLILGFTVLQALLMGILLSFSSTIIVMKFLNDRHEQYRSFSKVVVGLLFIEDLLAALVLVIIASADNMPLETTGYSWLFVKGVVLAIGMWLFARKALPLFKPIFSKSQELLFLAALAWAVSVGVIFDVIGFSTEVGALFAGVALATSPLTREITARLIPIRDFFFVIFFIALGNSLSLEAISEAIIPAIALALLVIIAKPLVIMLAMGWAGYTKHIRFKTAIYMGQISEFSIIIAALASTNGQLSTQGLSIIILVALISITVSSYFVKYAESLFRFSAQYLLTNIQEGIPKTGTPYHVVVLGIKKGGESFIRALKKQHETFIVIEHDPHNIPFLAQQKVDYMYGDANDPAILAEIDFTKVKMVISTITDHPTNLSVLAYYRDSNPKNMFIAHADDNQAALELYDMGATLVMMLQHIGSDNTARFIKKHGLKKQAFDLRKKEHLAYLKAN